MRVIDTHSPEETVELGRTLGRALAAGDVLALVGTLGAGKTQLTRGIALGTGATGRVTSPTFKLVNEYSGRLVIYHIDAYRLAGAEDLEAIGSEDFFDGDGAAVVEWADRVAQALPPDVLRVDIEVRGETERRITLTACGAQAERLMKTLG